MRPIVLAAIGGITFFSACAIAAGEPSEKPYVFEARSGEKVDAFRGQFFVPENRTDEDSRQIPIGYLRFRAPPQSDIPTLLLSGTLDGRTYAQSQQEAVSGLSRVTTVTVRNAGHNLFMVSPEVTRVIQQFMGGENLEVTTIALEPPSFAPQAE